MWKSKYSTYFIFMNLFAEFSIPLKVFSCTAIEKNISIPSNNIRSIPLTILGAFIMFQVAVKYIYIYLAGS